MDDLTARFDGLRVPVCVSRPVRQTIPVVISCPHAGRDYPPDFLDSARLSMPALRRSEDMYVDELMAASPELGAPLIAATFARAFCDPNREAWELDPRMFEEALPAWVNTTSPRVHAGLGMMARIVGNGEAIYGVRLPFAEAERRVRDFWQPYHDALQGLVEATRAAFGYCILLDCHSMPSTATLRIRPAPSIVLGDMHGTACDPRLMQWVERFFRDRSYLTRRNDPYAGGYVTRHYGRPDAGIHTLQIEVARSAYMNETSLERLPGFIALQRDLTALVSGLPELD